MFVYYQNCGKSTIEKDTIFEKYFNFMNFKNTYSPLWLFAFTVAIALTLPVLIRDGMFMDAVLYTSVSHNMSQGMGTFWFPYFDEHNVAGLTSFHEQPPLVFTIQSYFFRIFGDSLYVERFYTFCTMLLNAFLISKVWQTIYKGNENMQKMGWLAILFWITIPVCFWSYSNNMHENTMSIFVLLSVFTSLKIYMENKNPLYFILSGVFICLAFLSKGFPGLFVMGVPFFYWLSTKKITFKQMFFHTTIIVLTVASVAILLYLYEPSHQSLYVNYLQKRAFERINNAHSVDDRFFIATRLFSELIPAIILTVLLYVISKIKKIYYLFSENKSIAIFFILLGLGGSLPLMLTKVQNGFYMVASLPYFGLGFASILASSIYYFINKNIVEKNKIYSILSYVLFVGVVIVSALQIGKFSREKELIYDVHEIGKEVPKNEYIETATSEVYSNYSLQTYLMRTYNVGLRMGDAPYYIIEKNKNPLKSDLYTKVNLNTTQYDLYKKN